MAEKIEIEPRHDKIYTGWEDRCLEEHCVSHLYGVQLTLADLGKSFGVKLDPALLEKQS